MGRNTAARAGVANLPRLRLALNGLEHKARAEQGEKGGGSSMRAPRLRPVGNPLSHGAHGFSPTALRRGGCNVVKQVIQEGRAGAPPEPTTPGLIAPFDS